MGAEEQTARQRAEALAQHNASKLRVAQEQLAEWAVEKDRDAQHVLQQAQQLEQALRAATAGPSASSDDVLKSLAALRSLLQDNAASAQAFAAQMRTDVDRSKRSSQQVCVAASTAAGDAVLFIQRSWTADPEGDAGGGRVATSRLRSCGWRPHVHAHRRLASRPTRTRT